MDGFNLKQLLKFSYFINRMNDLEEVIIKIIKYK